MTAQAEFRGWFSWLA